MNKLRRQYQVGGKRSDGTASAPTAAKWMAIGRIGTPMRQKPELSHPNILLPTRGNSAIKEAR